ncbi:hypothetical protein PATSB16_23330 [Pandoraea thiooxydans]|nr:hypothetical protein PATSB16_23330 [Pandoraea thiooxydans]
MNFSGQAGNGSQPRNFGAATAAAEKASDFPCRLLWGDYKFFRTV